MAAQELELVVYGASGDFQYLTDLPLDWRSAADCGEPGRAAEEIALNNVFVPRSGLPVLTLAGKWADCAGKTWITDVRICESKAEYPSVVAGVLADLGVKGSKVATGERVAGSVIQELKRAELQSAAGLMDHLRMIKDPGEIERLREVARLTGRALGAVVPAIREGVTQGDLEAEVELQGRRLGASGVSFSSAVKFVKSGSQPSADPFTYPVAKGLVDGTCVVFDFGFVKDGYCSDFGRSFYFGDAPQEVRKGYEALNQGIVETVGRMHEGSMRICDLFPAVEATLDSLGYGEYLRARLPDAVLGHFIGIEVHEYPWLNPACEKPLRANMVMALEPKVWRAGEYYLRVEDMVLVGRDGTEFLTSFDRELFQL